MPRPIWIPTAINELLLSVAANTEYYADLARRARHNPSLSLL